MLLSACAGERVDNESTPLSLASDLFDGVFNPFFYTSGPDGEVVGQTQIGLLSSNESGTLVAGEEEPSVALDYSVVTRGKMCIRDRHHPVCALAGKLQPDGALRRKL